MKTIITVLAVAVVLGVPVRAQAINREWSAALGFLGGWLVASSVHSAPVYQERVYVQPSYPPPVYQERVYVQPSCPPPPVYQERVYVPAPYPHPIARPAPPRGRYEYRQHPIWVPGQWVHVRGHRGHARRVWEPGYYRNETVRVWVEFASGPEW